MKDLIRILTIALVKPAHFMRVPVSRSDGPFIKGIVFNLRNARRSFFSSQISRLLHRPSLLLNLFVDAIALAVRGAESEAHCKSAQLQKTPKSGYPSCELLILSACETDFRIEHGSLN